MTSPSPEPPEARAGSAVHFYRGKGGVAYHQGKRGLVPEALPWVMRLRAAKFQRHITPRSVVLEYGVGSGWNLGALNCARKIGFDVADQLADRARQLGIKFVGDTAALPNGTADVVLCHHVLEHIEEPRAALAEMRRLLKPGGCLVVHVPWERERRYRLYAPSEPNHHLYTWNAQTLGNLLALSGFDVGAVQVRNYGYDRRAAQIASNLNLGFDGFRVVRALLIALRPLREVEAICARG
jgi:SAM-dependent methyltransferase